MASRNAREGRYVGHGRHRGRWVALRSHRLRGVGRTAFIAEKRTRLRPALRRRLLADPALQGALATRGWHP